MKKKILSMGLVCTMVLTGCGSSAAEAIKVEDSTEVVETNVSEEGDNQVIESTESEEQIAETTESVEEVNIRDNVNVRNVCWGDTKEEVKKYETEATYFTEDEDDGDLMYEDSLGGYDVWIIYSFEDDKLFRASYIMNEKLTTGGQYLNAFESWHNSLIEKYGEANSDTNGINGIYYTVSQDQANFVDAGTALEYGYTGYIYTWELDNSKIVLSAQSRNYDISTVLIYQDINYDDSADSTDGF